MAIRTDTFDLGALRLTSGEGRHLELSFVSDPFELGGHTYAVTSAPAPVAAPEPGDLETQAPATQDELAEPRSQAPEVAAVSPEIESQAPEAAVASAEPRSQAPEVAGSSGEPLASVPDVDPDTGSPQIPAQLGVSRMTGQGYALHLSFDAALHGPCMRCLEPAHPRFHVDTREVSQPGEGEDLESPYVTDQELDLNAWARDALVLALPPALLCRPDCLGLCPVCGADLNAAGPDHAHESGPDPRWAALAELKLEAPDGTP